MGGGGVVAWIFLSLFLFFYLEIVADRTVNIGDNIVTALRQLNGSETLLFYSIFKTTNVNPHYFSGNINDFVFVHFRIRSQC